MAIRLIMRHDTAANWQAANPVLMAGELGFLIEDDENVNFKVGDGVTPFENLDYVLTPVTTVMILTLLGIPSYSSLVNANNALPIGSPYFNTTLSQLQITTA